ncbi:MAG: methyltransferase domain-containing protein [Candidatus Micrarchaeaceae archaeon]
MDCGSIYVNPAPCQTNLISFYPSDYYSDNPPLIEALLVGAIKRFYGRNRFSLLLSKLLTISGPKKILEIGPGNGDNLIPFLSQGIQTFAIEPNERLASTVTKLGVKVYNGFYQKATELPFDFDAVILSHVLEHEYEPFKMLEYCKEHMKVGGLIYVEIPTLDSPSFRVFSRYWGGLSFPCIYHS